MGDSQIFFTVTLQDMPQTEASSAKKVKKSVVLAADSTLCEFVTLVNTTITQTVEEGSTSMGDNDHAAFVFGTTQKDTKNNESDGKKILVPLNMYDCTTYPPKNITDLVLEYTSTVGPKSITLQKLGWFPSAKILICQSDDEASISSVMKSNVHISDEFEYNAVQNINNVNNHANSNTTRPQVQLSGELGTSLKNKSNGCTMNNKPLPSEIFKAVEERFEKNDDRDINDNGISNDDPYAAQIQLKIHKRQKERERRKLLDMRIEQLDQVNSNLGKKKGKSSSSTVTKKKKVSDQVKRMLIKSRAIGDKKMRQEDRFYLETVLLDETKMKDDSSSGLNLLGDESQQVEEFMSSSYTFYSKVATIGKIISSTVGSSASARDVGAELLILTLSNEDGEDDDLMVYRRLPPTLPLHEAESKGFISSFGKVIVRIFKAKTDSIAECYTQSVII